VERGSVGLMREGRGLMFLSGLLLGMGIMLIIWAATPTTRLICTNPEISTERDTIQING
jgi:hypothetical protein